MLEESGDVFEPGSRPKRGGTPMTDAIDRPIPADDETTISAARLAAQCVHLADKECKGYSPLYERLARQLAEDHELIERLRRVPEPNRVPVNLFAAVNWLVRRDPGSELARIYAGAAGDPWPPFRELVDSRFDEVVELLATRSIQTNEVGRCSALVPAFAAVVDAYPGRPLGLVEIGPSAGLNLFFDRYVVAYDDGRTFGDSKADVRLSCQLVGPGSPPLPEPGELVVASREGIDLSPVDVRDDESCAWLEACIWPDVPGRLERFQAAVRLARDDPPTLHRGNALDLLGPVVDRLPADRLPVVVTTWALAYLDRDGRRRIHDALADRGATRDLVLVTAEFPHTTPWIPSPPRPPTDQEKGATLLSMTTWTGGVEQRRPLAWMHAHGLWLDWFEPVETHA
jgi:hypothetical protein